MPDFTIVLGNKRYSSWSLRGWLVLKQSGAEFAEIVIPLDRAETKGDILRHSPSGKVPALKTPKATVWDSLAIAEFLHERFPRAGLWPSDAAARARARAISAEMHAGFAALRRHLPIDMCTRDPDRGERARAVPQVAADIERILAIWTGCRGNYSANGDFLFGAWCAADAFYTPVAARFATYGIPLSGAAAAYCDAVLAWPAMGEWIAAARAESWVIDYPELKPLPG